MNDDTDVWRGMICLSLAVGFEEDRARLGLPAAVDRLRDALACVQSGRRVLFATQDGRRPAGGEAWR